MDLALAVPALRDLFRFGPLGPEELLLGSAAGIASILWFEVFKVIYTPTPAS